jgi:hypothetical protein
MCSPVQSNNFTLLVEKGNFVHKTRAIVEFLDDRDKPNHPVALQVLPVTLATTTAIPLYQ